MTLLCVYHRYGVPELYIVGPGSLALCRRLRDCKLRGALSGWTDDESNLRLQLKTHVGLTPYKGERVSLEELITVYMEV